MERLNNHTSGDFGINASHEVKPIGNLVALVKKPLEDYFEGTKRRKQKAKHHKAKQNLNQESQSQLNAPESINRTEKNEISSELEKTRRKNLELKIYKYEKIREYKERNNYIQQRLAEQKYIQQQENLAETWLECIKRRKQMKSDKSSHSEPTKAYQRNSACNCSKVNISILSEKYWGDEADKSSSERAEDKKKKEKSESNKDILDFTNIFTESLVFVDDEDDD